MAFRARDGRAFGNRQRMKAYDERSSSRTSTNDARDERSAGQRQEHGGSLESKPHQPPEEVEHQQRTGQNPARNPNPGPREVRPSSPEPGEDDLSNPGEAAEGLGGGPESDLSSMNINDVVARHGPADTVQIRSSGGMHHVTTSHGGRRHVTTHPTPESAALHAADSMGLNQAKAELAGSPMPEDQIPGVRRSNPRSY